MVFAGRVPTQVELEEHYRDYGHAWHDSPITRRRYRELLDSFEPHRATNRILDFGCGAGFFLEEARARGWEAHGTEFSGLALELARSKELPVLEAPVTADAFPAGHFDVITAFEVFEHVEDPRGQAALIARWLRPGGLLYCTTPNFASLSRRLLGSRWNVIDYPEHLCYFTPATLRSWLGGSGFRTESVRSTGVSVSRLRNRAPAPAQEGQPVSADEQLREAIEGSRLLGLGKRAANGVLSALGLGDTLKGRFRLSA
jgi:2-polyprenyl-3-methyl-5-hydroxy-6-metoxy-1,4-benzoquinol methylase